jgi:hypothetical protein
MPAPTTIADRGPPSMRSPPPITNLHILIFRCYLHGALHHPGTVCWIPTSSRCQIVAIRQRRLVIAPNHSGNEFTPSEKHEIARRVALYLF